MMRAPFNPDLMMPVEMLLVLMIVLHEGGRAGQFGLLAERVCDRLRIGPAERELLMHELEGHRLEAGSIGVIRALRAMGENEREAIAAELLDFASADPLLSPHRRRLRIRILDILALDAAD